VPPARLADRRPGRAFVIVPSQRFDPVDADIAVAQQDIADPGTSMCVAAMPVCIRMPWLIVPTRAL
jgi:hypothetical protein